jgi:hypothetical protein
MPVVAMSSMAFIWAREKASPSAVPWTSMSC